MFSKTTSNPRFVYPMSRVGEFLTNEEIEKMSETTHFEKDDKFFHFSKDGGWVESLNEEDINLYNSAMPTNKILLKVA